MDGLKGHKRVHSQERPFQCNYCEKGFKQKCNLRTHERRHLGEKPYRCDTKGCQKAFTTSSDLNRHTRMTTSISSEAKILRKLNKNSNHRIYK